MKKKILIINIVIIIIIIIIYLGLVNYKVESKIYNDRSFLNDAYTVLMLDISNAYYNSELECIKNLTQKADLMSNEQYYKFAMNDYFTSDSNDLLHYIPVYDNVTKKREAFLLLSAGFDGKINNKISWKDSLFKHQLNEKLSLYNSVKFDDYFVLDSSLRGNYRDVVFGKKDVVILYMDCFEYYKNSGKGVVDKYFISKVFTNKRLRTNKTINLKLIDYETRGSKIITEVSGLKIEANVVSSKFNNFLPESDTVYVTGHISRVDYDSNYILINNAVIYPSSPEANK